MMKKLFKFPISNFQFLIGNKGLTLLEIAISLAILSIALVALVNLFTIGLKFSRRATNFSSASILAQRVIENIKRAASVYEIDDNGPSGSPFNDGDGMGYFELAHQDTGPFVDSPDATIISLNPIHYKYDNPNMNVVYKDMDVYIKVDDWDANGNGTIGDLDDILLSQKVYVAVYWFEGDKERADTFITYIANPFYEKYR